MVGKQTFVTYYELLVDFDFHDDELADLIASDLSCTFDNAMSWQVKPARKLIKWQSTILRVLFVHRVIAYLTYCAEV